jgi:hypothetical protein
MPADGIGPNLARTETAEGKEAGAQDGIEVEPADALGGAAPKTLTPRALRQGRVIR